MIRFENQLATLPGSQPIVSASVLVVLPGTSTAISLYNSDNIADPRTNPVTTDANGRFWFYAANQKVDLQISGTGFTPYTLANVPIFDGNELTAAQVTNAFDVTVADILTNVVAPTTPVAGKTKVWVDSTDKRWHDKNDAGVIGTTVVASSAGAHQFATAVSAAGVLSYAQPAFSDVSGSVAASQLPNPSATTLGGIESLTAVAHKWINTISTAGVPSATQPTIADIDATSLANNAAIFGTGGNGLQADTAITTDGSGSLSLVGVTARVIGTVRNSASFNFVRSPSSPTSIVVGANTVTLATCPPGVNGTDVKHYLYVSTTGTPEAVLITGGTCTGGAASGTVIFTAVNTHAAGYTIASATGGVQEAWNDMPDGGGTFVEAADHTFFGPFSTNARGGTLFGVGFASHLTGDPGSNPIVLVNNGVTHAHPVTVYGLRITNTHTITDNNPNGLRIQSGSSVHIHHNIFDGGKYGVQATSNGGGGQTENVQVDHNFCYGAAYGGSLKDTCVSVNGDGTSLPTLAVNAHHNFSGDLATSGLLGPPHDFVFEDCDRCSMHDNLAININGFTESNASAFMIYANHNTSVNHSRAYRNTGIFLGTTPTYAGMTGLSGASKTYVNVDYSGNMLYGYKGCISVQGTSGADYTWNGVKVNDNKCPATFNGATAAIYLAVSGAQQLQKIEIAGNSVYGTGLGSAAGIRCDLIRGGVVRDNNVRLMGSTGILFQGSSDMQVADNQSNDNGQNATSDGFRLNSQGGVGSSNNQIIGNDFSDYQASPTQNRGGNNNDTTNNTGNFWSLNKAFNNITAPVNDTEATAKFGVNFWNVSGTNKAGIDQPLAGVLGTGTGAGGKVLLKVGDTQTTGTTAHSPRTLLSLNPGTVADPTNDEGCWMGSHGEQWCQGQNTELLTLSTVGATTDTTNNLLPANAIIEAVVARVTTTITTATDWKLGDPTTAGRFSAANATLTAGTTQIGLVHSDQTGAAGPKQTAAAKVRVTTTGTPGAGVIRILVFYRRFIAPTS